MRVRRLVGLGPRPQTFDLKRHSLAVTTLFSSTERRLLGGLAVVTLASWGRFFATGSLKVD